MATAVFPTPFVPGFRLVDGTDLNSQFGNPITSSQTTVTAKASGTQTNSTAITAAITNVTTVATAADGVLLPAAKAGATYTLVNNGAAAMTVFASGSDTINGTAGSTGVSQAAGTTSSYRAAVAGKWLAGGGVAGAGTFTTLSASGLFTESGGGVSAAGTNQATGTALVSNINNLTTVGASTGVVLPSAAGAGLAVYVFNKGAQNVQVYGNGSDTIDGTAGATGVALGHTAGTNSCIFFSTAAATWVSAKLGAVSS